MNLKFNLNAPAWALFAWAVFILWETGGNVYGTIEFVMQLIAIGVLCFLVSGENCRIGSLEEGGEA